MKIKRIALLLICFLLLSVSALQAQNANISVSKKNVNLHEILLEIKKQSGKNIIYNNNIVERYDHETIELSDVTLIEALNVALQDKDLQYKIIEDVILIEPLDSKQQPDATINMNQTIRGNVYDEETNTPLAGATVIVTLPQKTVASATDENGNFKISGIPIGRQSVVVSYIGYKKKRIDNLMVLSAKECVLNIGLEESVSKLDEVNVTAYNKTEPVNEMATVSARAFTIEETEKYAGSWGDPSRMATNFAGVFTAGDQRNDIIIRGNSPAGLLWELEDIPIPSPNHFDVIGTTGGPISMLNNNLLSRSDFFTSAFPAEYGNATSGVFDLKLRNGNTEKREYLAQIGFNGFEGGAEGPISPKNKSSYIINMRYSMLGLVHNLLWVEGLPQYEDVSFKINFPLKAGKISIFGLGGKSSITQIDDDDLRSNSSGEYKLNSLNGSKTGIAGVNYMYLLNSNTNVRIAVAWSTRRPFEVVDSTLSEIPYLRLADNSYRENEFSIKSKLTKKINSCNLVSTGILIQNMYFNANRMTYDNEKNKITIDEPYTISGSNMVLSQLYLQWKHDISDKLSLTSGINLLYFRFNKTSAADPRFGLSWHVAEKQNLGFGYGIHSQIQPLNVYYIRSKTGLDNGKQVYADLMTNKNLDFTRSHQFALSHDYLFNQNLRLKTELYYQYLFNVPVKQSKGYFSMVNIGAAMSVPEEDSLINAGYGKNYGIELTLEKFLSQHYYFLITSSIFNSLYRGSDKIWRNTAYNGHFVFNVLGGYEYEIGKNVLLNANLRITYAGGRRVIPYDLKKSLEENDNYYLYDQAYEKQVKDYFRTDLRVGVIIPQKKVTHELALDIVNLTNHKNVYREKYNKTDYQQGFFPMGLYRVNF